MSFFSLAPFRKDSNTNLRRSCDHILVPCTAYCTQIVTSRTRLEYESGPARFFIFLVPLIPCPCPRGWLSLTWSQTFSPYCFWTSGRVPKTRLTHKFTKNMVKTSFLMLIVVVVWSVTPTFYFFYLFSTFRSLNILFGDNANCSNI